MTKDLSKFGQRELSEAINLLKALKDSGFPEDFNGEGVSIEFNQKSGVVFFINSDNETCFDSKNQLFTFFACANCFRYGVKGDFEVDENGCCEDCTLK